MIETYKVMSENYDRPTPVALSFSLNKHKATKDCKLNNARPRYNLRTYYFNNMVINSWNCLPKLFCQIQ